MRNFLVLDEATSALDNRTEAEVMEVIDSVNRNITVILSSHRLSTVERFGHILFVDQERFAGLGSYLELDAGNATFHELSR